MVLLLSLLTIYAFGIRAVHLRGYDFGPAWDEGYYASSARHISEDPSDLLLPKYLPHSSLLVDKPPAYFWLGAASVKIFGVNEFSYRLVTIMFGTFSVLVFYLLIATLYGDRKMALISSAVFASFPLHVAFSRIFQMDVSVLFYSMLIALLLIQGTDRKKAMFFWITSMLIALSVLTKIWFGLFTIIGAYVWLFMFRRSRAAFLAESIKAFVWGLLIFLIWPMILWLTPSAYAGFQLGSRTVWGMLFRTNVIERIPWSPAMFLRLFAGYQGLGHFDFSYLISWPIVVFLAAGLIIMLIETQKPAMKAAHSFWLIWIVAYLPFQIGKEHLLQYLVILTPVASVLVSIVLLRLYETLRAPTISLAVLLLMLGLIMLAPVKMIWSGHEVLYRTYYREMGSYLKDRTKGFRYSVICRYTPGMLYYTDKPALRWDQAKSPLSRYFIGGLAKYIEITDDERDNLLPLYERNWVKKHCRNIDALAGVPAESPHQLYEYARN